MNKECVQIKKNENSIAMPILAIHERRNKVKKPNPTSHPESTLFHGWMGPSPAKSVSNGRYAYSS